jgi:hypothetical protein
MVTPELIDYVKKSLEEGHSPESIRKALLDSGWSAEQADEAINHVAPRQQPASVPHEKEKATQKKSRKIPLALIIIVIIGGGIALWFFVISPILYSLLIFNPADYTARIPTGFTTLGAPNDWDLASNGDFAMILKNNKAEQIEVEKIEISFGTASDSYEPSTPITIGPGSTHNLYPSDTGLNLGPQSGTYSVDVMITYKSSSGFTHMESGTVSGTVS